MNAPEDAGQQPAKRNRVWVILAVLLMFASAFCAGEWYLARGLSAELSLRSDLANMARGARVRSEHFGLAALASFLLSVFLLGFTAPRSSNPRANRLRGYIRGLILTALGTLGFLILDVALFGLLVRNIHLQ
jgi:hypothetical protein